MKYVINSVLILASLLLFSLINISSSIALKEEKEIEETYKDMTFNKEQNKLRRYMIFEINKEEIKDPENFSRVIVDFFLSNNYQNGVYNLNNRMYVAYLSKTDDIKIKQVREYFGNAFTKVYWYNSKNKEHDFRKRVLAKDDL